jgi:hypothetical protein
VSTQRLMSNPGSGGGGGLACDLALVLDFGMAERGRLDLELWCRGRLSSWREKE